MPAKSAATKIVRKLVDEGHIAYFAGGWVRDMLLRFPSDDIDIATSASVQEIQKLFPKTIPVGVAFGIVIVVQDGLQFEVATFRKEGGYVDGRRPMMIEPASPEEDAERRDFTINGLFYDPLKEKLIDFVEGVEDIKRGVVRAIGDPNARFQEDRLRMMRAVRYSTRFDFPIEEETLKAIIHHAENLFPSVAIERVWQEFKKMSQFSHFDKGLVSLHYLKLLGTIFPSLKNISSQEIEKRVSVIAHFPPNTPTIAQLLELFPNQSLEEDLKLADYLKLSGQDREILSYLHRIKTVFNMPQEWQKKMEKIEWVKLYAHAFAKTGLKIAFARYPEEKRVQFLQESETRMEELKAPIERALKKIPLLRAERLLQLGIPPGKNMGLLLEQAERIAVTEGINDPDVLLERLKQSPLYKASFGQEIQ